MSQPIEWSPEAVDALEEIHAFMEQRSPAAASRFVDDVADIVQTVATFPEIGRVVEPESNRRFRQMPIGNYRVVYRLHADGITIETIVHASAELP
ncbi:MAG: type II toxin-antitoxin system RelE/ParE family toxin [Dehalococcoidia bacterium]